MGRGQGARGNAERRHAARGGSRLPDLDDSERASHRAPPHWNQSGPGGPPVPYSSTVLLLASASPAAISLVREAAQPHVHDGAEPDELVDVHGALAV